MNDATKIEGLLHEAVTSVRIVLVSMSICCLLYPLAILGVAQTLTPYSAGGSLIRNERGVIVGSEILAQAFSRPEYFWPRPSAVGYDASGAGGSNLSPTNPELRFRAEALVIRSSARPDNPIPADAVTASGSGLDPHITMANARHQAGRVASARGLPTGAVLTLLEECANRQGGALNSEPIVNVLLVNMALDRLGR